ncbi:WhiB family transcriptional regulator [Janibacter indicus]|uniref:WhiB family transcriptional regulator n=1 Tax=Janibacter indicus TaxID=857417 RepID=A0A7L9J319_9MICO|nr:WhiB family transcriptional regulator [Janibacter indicus]QOK24011.1 WhiB family transcriptional regulator [Janibacter indicus]
MTADALIEDATTRSQALSARRRRIEETLDLPPRPKRPERDSETDWMSRARCADEPAERRLAFVAVARQRDARDLVTTCASCPVATECLADGRRSHLSGLAGGLVLDDGHLAQDRRGDLAFRSTAAWHRDVPAQLVEPEELVDLAREGGITAAEAARALLGDDEPASVKFAGTVLRSLVAEGQLEHVPGPPRVSAGGRQPGRWVIPGEEDDDA